MLSFSVLKVELSTGTLGPDATYASRLTSSKWGALTGSSHCWIWSNSSPMRAAHSLDCVSNSCFLCASLSA
ncbi:hypothetical protein D3C72_1973630 [compost metagenome]